MSLSTTSSNTLSKSPDPSSSLSEKLTAIFYILDSHPELVNKYALEATALIEESELDDMAICSNLAFLSSKLCRYREAYVRSDLCFYKFSNSTKQNNSLASISSASKQNSSVAMAHTDSNDSALSTTASLDGSSESRKVRVSRNNEIIRNHSETSITISGVIDSNTRSMSLPASSPKPRRPSFKPARKDLCVQCGATSTSQWRTIDKLEGYVCNSCGTFARKLIKKIGLEDTTKVMSLLKREGRACERSMSKLPVLLQKTRNL